MYYCTLGSPALYRVATHYLRNFALTSGEIGQHVEVVLKDKGISDGMTMDANGNLFFGDNARNTISVYNPVTGARKDLYQNDSNNIWVDTLAFQGSKLLWTANSLPLFMRGGLAPGQDTLAHLWAHDVGAHSYLDGNPTPSSAPCVDR